MHGVFEGGWWTQRLYHAAGRPHRLGPRRSALGWSLTRPSCTRRIQIKRIALHYHPHTAPRAPHLPLSLSRAARRYNDGDSAADILFIDFFHPELSQAEQTAIKCLQKLLRDYGEEQASFAAASDDDDEW